MPQSGQSKSGNMKLRCGNTYLYLLYLDNSMSLLFEVCQSYVGRRL